MKDFLQILHHYECSDVQQEHFSVQMFFHKYHTEMAYCSLISEPEKYHYLIILKIELYNLCKKLNKKIWLIQNYEVDRLLCKVDYAQTILKNIILSRPYTSKLNSIVWLIEYSHDLLVWWIIGIQVPKNEIKKILWKT